MKAFTNRIDRRIQSESSTGSSSSQRIRLTLTIVVATVDFDPQAGLLRINGKVSSENQYVKVSKQHVQLTHNELFGVLLCGHL